MKKNKILIYTLCNSCNYGAFLQAFALQEFLKNNSFDVNFFKNNQNINKEKFDFIIRKDFRKIPLNIVQYNKFKTSWSNLNISDNNKADYAIIGSDELWNVNNPSFNHLREYFGYNINCEKIISYAPSCNKVNAQDLKKFDSELNFDKFDEISVRDSSTQKLVYDYTGKNVPIVLDPTFLLDSYSNYEEKIKENQKYILVYGYNFDKESRTIIKKFAESKKLKLIAIGLQQMWCDKNVAATPFEFLSYIKNAEYIITETFHGTIFSILYKKQFVNLSLNKNKVNFLLKTFNLENRKLNNLNEIDSVLNKKIDYDEVYKIINSEREKSRMWLINTLKRDCK